jgi:hypothetical protein
MVAVLFMKKEKGVLYMTGEEILDWYNSVMGKENA